METIRDFLDSIYADYSVVSFRGGRLIRGKLREIAGGAADALKQRLNSIGWLHSFEKIDGVDYLTCTVMDAPVAHRLRLHILLFLATVFTTMLGGSDVGFSNTYNALASVIIGLVLTGHRILATFPTVSINDLAYHGLNLAYGGVGGLLHQMWLGIPFGFAILAILGCHEMGHYVMARRHGMNATLPFFIPLPAGIGTLGAVIRIKSPLVHRRMVLDVGAAGPLAGAVVALVFLVIGTMLSKVGPTTGDAFGLGDSLLTKGLVALIHGSVPAGKSLYFHPFAFAGWIGLLVTAVNLMPIGQLDGGHVAYALFGQFQRRLATMTYGMLITFGLIGIHYGFRTGSWPYLLFAAFTRAFMKPAHPPVLDETVKLDTLRKAIAIICIILLILCFVPSPYVFDE